METDNEVDLGRGLLLACNDGDIDKVQYYIEEKHVSPTWNKKSIFDRKEIDAAQNRGISGIHLAAWRNHVDVLQYLIDQGVDVNLRQCYGATPLHYAAWGGCKDTVQFLLTNFSEQLDYKIQDSQGRTALHDCVDIGNLEILSILYEHIKQCKDRRWMKEVADVEGNTLLHHAIVTPNKKDELREKTVDFLLMKQFHLKKKNKYGNTPLTEACLKGRYNIVCQFSDHYRRNLHSEEGFQLDLTEALLTCALNGKTAMVQKLIEGMKMSITSSNAFKETVFHKAVEGGCLDTIKFLVNYVKSHQIPYLVQVKAEGQQTQHSNEVQIRSSFHTLATILNLRDAEDRNVFHYAVAKNAKTNTIKKKVLDYLLQEGCEKPQNNEAIWQDVERHCSKELVKWLSQRSEQPVKNEDSKKRKMQQAAKLHEKQQAAKQIVEAIRSLPFSKRRKTLNSKLAEDEELPTLDEFTALKDKVGTMTTTIQSLESKVSLLTQELELCKQTFFSMAPLQIPDSSSMVAQQQTVEDNDLDFSNALFPC